jgi:cyanate permease
MDLPEVGSQYMGSAAGMFFCIAELGGFAGPFMIGAVKDLTGSFVVGACLTAGLAGMMSMIAFHLRDIAK